jgi:Uncharacterized protein/domain associated with GTPases
MKTTKDDAQTQPTEEPQETASTTLEADEVIDPEPSEARALKALKASKTIDNHVLGAMGVGIVPIPLVDLLGVAGLQLHLLNKLAGIYGHSCSAEMGKKLIASITGGAVSAFAAYPLSMVLRSIPVVGWTLGAGSRSILSGATTYAVGRVFAQHFDKGGTLLDLNLDKAKSSFKDHYEKGKEWCSSFGKKPATAEA